MLVGACWAGANLVPVQLDPASRRSWPRRAHRSGRRYASIFGPAETVLALYARWSSWATPPTRSGRTSP